MNEKDNQEDRDIKEIPEGSVNTILSSQISAYQHVQSTATTLLNVTIGVISVIVAGFSVGFVSIPSDTEISISEFSQPFGASEELIAITMLLSIFSFIFLLFSVMLILFGAYSNVGYLLWPRNISPIFTQSSLNVKISNQGQGSKSMEESVNSNNDILNELHGLQSDSYRAFVVGIILISMILTGIIGALSGESETILLIHSFSLIVVITPPLGYTIGYVLDTLYNHYVVWKEFGLHAYTASCYVSLRRILSVQSIRNANWSSTVRGRVKSAYIKIDLRGQPTIFILALLAGHISVSILVYYYWWGPISSEAVNTISELAQSAGLFV
ncbi:hypothetical protein PN416_12770 [Halorubrum ezzemoulense]|uniref:hypothetical protein n=1 Tax=Halorubrum ezzemoulense TaxID=337243 RepID=UPI00232DCD9A|nr:hypothetical protein [Halorubrum ezzemoulense]MDB9280517.1 hypothetical protein [Halorubrum ezzemoulense]MDB9284304.1 hypothetical protein [Halorubrum ezzemoulense]